MLATDCHGCLVRGERQQRDGMDAISVEDVAKFFGSVGAVEGLSARIPKGCIYGFLGPNGAGKTTTLRMLVNIISPDKGRIEILGRESLEQVSEEIGYMPEERGLYPKMKVRAVLSYFASLKGVRDGETEVIRWLDEVGLSEWGDKKVGDLSRGMQQKLQFAVTAIGDPDILILDEPFSGLDPVSLDLLKDILLRWRKAGKTVLFSTHMMDHAERLCDSILLINKGNKVLDGTLEEIRSRYRTNTVSTVVEGDAAFVADLPMVLETEPKDGRLEISLREDGDSQELLRALIDRVRVVSFEEKAPSLHEIFVRLVGEDDA